MTLLPDIPFERLGKQNWDILLDRHRDRAHDLIRNGRDLVKPMPLRVLDGLSRRWAQRSNNRHYDLISKMAADMPAGLWFMNFCYEWGCTTRVGSDPHSGTPIMLRCLDWPFNGIGRNLIMVEKGAHVGAPYFAATWPGYTAVITGMKPGAFAAAINQAPLSAPIQFHFANWGIARGKVWRSRAVTPGHLLEQVFDEVEDFQQAKKILCETPVALPVIYSLTGIRDGEACVIERTEYDYLLREGEAVAANHWEGFGHLAQSRGVDSAGRSICLAASQWPPEQPFSWLDPPVLNGDTRLAAELCAKTGDFRLRGYEANGPATSVFDLADRMSDTKSKAAQKI